MVVDRVNPVNPIPVNLNQIQTGDSDDFRGSSEPSGGQDLRQTPDFLLPNQGRLTYLKLMLTQIKT